MPRYRRQYFIEGAPDAQSRGWIWLPRSTRPDPDARIRAPVVLRHCRQSASITRSVSRKFTNYLEGPALDYFPDARKLFMSSFGGNCFEPFEKDRKRQFRDKTSFLFFGLRSLLARRPLYCFIDGLPRSQKDMFSKSNSEPNDSECEVGARPL